MKYGGEDGDANNIKFSHLLQENFSVDLLYRALATPQIQTCNTEMLHDLPDQH